jgi:hypothetical protein
VVLDPEEDTSPDARRGAPRPDRVRDMAQVQVAGRRRREPGRGARRDQREVRSGRRLPASAPDPLPPARVSR